MIPYIIVKCISSFSFPHANKTKSSQCENLILNWLPLTWSSVTYTWTSKTSMASIFFWLTVNWNRNLQLMSWYTCWVVSVVDARHTTLGDTGVLMLDPWNETPTTKKYILLHFNRNTSYCNSKFHTHIYIFFTFTPLQWYSYLEITLHMSDVKIHVFASPSLGIQIIPANSPIITVVHTHHTVSIVYPMTLM